MGFQNSKLEADGDFFKTDLLNLYDCAPGANTERIKMSLN